MHHVRALVVGLCVLLLAGCTGMTGGRAGRSTPTTSSTAAARTREALGRPGCRPASPIDRRAGFTEVRGTSHAIQMWGLIMVAGPVQPLHVKEDVKIVWRITGSGPLHLATVGPDGRRHRLQWGPELHGGSNYNRPGDEWGAGYRFDRPGCWTLRATRGSSSASVWLKIAA
jgi:hypothetical protein